MKRFERSNGLDTALYKNYLYLYLNFRNITDTMLWPVTMLPITVENDPNASLNMWNGKVMY